MRGKTAADVRFEPHQRAHRGARHVHDVIAVEHRERGRIAGDARQLFEMRLGQVLDVHRLEIGGAELEHLGPQQERAAAPRDVAELFEREQAAARRRRGHAGGRGDFTERERRVIARKRLDDREALGEPAHDFAARCG